PALIRTAVTTTRQSAEGQKVTAGKAVLTLLSSVGVVAVVGVASVAAFYAACFAVCAVGFGFGGGARGSEDVILIASVSAGVVPGVAVAILLFWLLWRRRKARP